MTDGYWLGLGFFTIGIRDVLGLGAMEEPRCLALDLS